MPWCPGIHRHGSGGLAVVEIQHPAQPGPANDLATRRFLAPRDSTMADEPLNPYTPSRAAEMAPETAPQGRASGILAVVASLLCAQPFAGLGLYVLGRKRRFLAWAVPATLAEVLMIVGAWTGLSTLFLVALGAILLLVLGSFVDTLMARSSSAAPSFRRALVTVLLVFVGGRAALYGVKQWLVEGFSIPSAAMVRSLLVGDHVMVKKKVDDVRLGGSAFAVHGRGVGDE